ncbi:hypothetical protein FJZ17_03245 [Candidatus Pacearchaeota archaeon]|nr:hypothetical protein [Candidatus Pacearchaeota archaeon]
MVDILDILRAIKERRFEGDFFTDKTAERIPKGSYHAPSFVLDNPENHDNMGYHGHLLKLHSGEYRRCGYLLTCDDNSVWCVEHGGARLIDARSQANAIRQDVREQVSANLLIKPHFLRVSPKDIASGKAFRLFVRG